MTTPRNSRVPAEVARHAPLHQALHRYAAAAVRHHGVDPVTTELVRLRCATYHDCHT